MQTLLKLLTLISIFQSVSSLRAQEVEYAETGEEIYFSFPLANWGNPYLQYSANGDAWNDLFAWNPDPIVAGPETTGFYRLRMYDEACDSSYFSNVVEIIVADGAIGSLECETVVLIGSLVDGAPATSVFAEIDYANGNGGLYTAQTINSNGVTGLTAAIAVGNFANGDGSLVIDISGTPEGSGVANFTINIGGQLCNMELTVVDGDTPLFPPGTVHCSGAPTEVVEVINPATGEIWMDRNLGAAQVATSITDTAAFGDLYQWGRRADGHQCRTSNTTNIQSVTEQPEHGDFIVLSDGSNDWLNPSNVNLWQGLDGVNNPCPEGFRVPSNAELIEESQSWGSEGAFGSPLKLTAAGVRGGESLDYQFGGLYWSSSNAGPANSLAITTQFAGLSFPAPNMGGVSVRCIKD